MYTRQQSLSLLLGAWIFLGLVACSEGGQEEGRADQANSGPLEDPSFVEPQSGPMSGYFHVRLQVNSLGLAANEVEEAWFGSQRAIDLDANNGDELIVRVQGHPTPGPVDVSLIVNGESYLVEDAFTFTPPIDPVFEKVVAIGASLTMGVQRGTPTNHGAFMSPGAQLARQMGAYFPLPIFSFELFPQLEIESIGPPPECFVPGITQLATSGTADTIPKLTDPQTGKIDFALARADAEMEVHNLAVGGTNLHDLLERARLTDVPVNFMSHLVYQPYGELFERIEETQLERVEAMKPTFILSTDLYGNDLIAPFVNDDYIDLERATPLEDLERDLELVVARLAATGAYVFLANLPSPNLLPAAAEKRRAMLAQAPLEEREELAHKIDADIGEILFRTEACNAALAREADRYEKVFVVDLAVATEGLAKVGLKLGGDRLSVEKFGGLLGLDGVHFTDTGYALIATLFLNEINKQLGVDIPYLDFEAVLEADVESPLKLLEGGLDPSLCD